MSDFLGHSRASVWNALFLQHLSIDRTLTEEVVAVHEGPAAVVSHRAEIGTNMIKLNSVE